MNLQMEINSLKQRVAELEELAKEEQEFPQVGDEYWFITDRGMIFDSEFKNKKSDRDSLEIGNIFQTKEQAEFAVEKLKVEAELRKFSRPFEPMRDNFFMVYDKYLESLENNCSLKTDIQGVIYFGSREEIRQAAQSVGIERIKKYIFGVEE